MDRTDVNYWSLKRKRKKIWPRGHPRSLEVNVRKKQGLAGRHLGPFEVTYGRLCINWGVKSAHKWPEAKKGQFNPGGPFYIIAVALGPPMNTFGGCALIRAWNPVVGQTDKKGVISWPVGVTRGHYVISRHVISKEANWRVSGGKGRVTESQHVRKMCRLAR